MPKLQHNAILNLMRIILKPHLKIRLKQRLISQTYPRKILTQADNEYYDPLTNHHIAIKKLAYNKKLRPMVIAYDIIGEEIQVITVYPTTKQEIKNRVQKRRWIEYEQS